MPRYDKTKLIAWVRERYDYDGLSHRATQAFTGWDTADGTVFFGKIREVIDILDEVVDIVEKFARDADSISGKQKLEAVVEFLDDIVKLNFLLEMVDGLVIKMIVSTIVTQKNKWFGEDWIKDSD